MAENENSTLKQIFGASTACPPIDVLSGLLQRSEGDVERRRAEAHVAECPHCRTEISLLREFEAGVVRPDEAEAVRWITYRLAPKPAPAAVSVSVRWWQRGWVPGFAGAAAVILLATGLSMQWAARQRAVPDFGVEAQRSHAVGIVENPSAFQWKPVAGAAKYDLTVREIDGLVVFNNSISTQTLVYPAEVVRTMSTGKVLLWDVVARDAGGNEIARSAVQRLQRENSGNK
jgi:hypothetical protein